MKFGITIEGRGSEGEGGAPAVGVDFEVDPAITKITSYDDLPPEARIFLGLREMVLEHRPATGSHPCSIQ